MRATECGACGSDCGHDRYLLGVSVGEVLARAGAMFGFVYVAQLAVKMWFL